MLLTRLINWCNRLIKLGFYLLFGLVPLLLTPWNYELFEYNKMMAVYAITSLVTASWLVKSIAQKEFRIAKTPLDIPLALFVTSQLVSSLFSLDRHISWFGYYSRFNGGVWSVISYALLYYAFASNWPSLSSHIANLLKISLSTASVVALYGVLERLGIDKHLWVQDVQNRVFSTLGQPNWLAAYLVALAPLAMAFGLKAQNPKQGNWYFGFSLSFGFWIWSLIAALFFLVLLFTRSRSGLLGFVAADLLFWGLLYLKHKQEFLSRFRVPLIAYHLLLVIIVFFNGSNIAQLDKYFSLSGWRVRLWQAKTAAPIAPSYQAPLLESGGTESGTIRKYVWQGAINAWRSTAKTILIGTGTETFALAFFQFKPGEHNLTSEWDFLYNKAHNEYLNYLATTGVLGLGSYLLFIATFIIWFAKAQISKLKAQIKSKTQSLNHLDFNIDLSFGFWVLSLAIFTGWTSILVTNFFGFSVVVVQLFFFLFPAMIFALERGNETTKLRSFSLKIPSWIVWLPIIIGAYLLVKLGSFWYADTLFARGYRLAKLEQYPAAQGWLAQAIKLNPGEPLYRDEAATTLAALTEIALESKNATAAAALARQSLAESDLALTISPNNVNFWKSRTKIYYTFTSFDPEFLPAAVEALKKALSLSPTDPKILYNLAILYGRQDDNSQAIETLKTAISLKPNWRDAYFALYIFYNDVKQPELGRAVLAEYLTKVDPNDKDFRERLEK